MFEFAAGNTCFWPVVLPQRGDDGQVTPCEVLLQFRLFTRTELQEQRFRTAAETARQLADAVARAGEPEAAADREQAIQALRDQEATEDAEVRERLIGWKGIGRAGEELPYSVELRDWLLADEPRYLAIREGLLVASRGARAKN